MPNGVDPHLYAQALADIQAIPTPKPKPPTTPTTSSCCTGDRAGYLRHRWHNQEPCAASRQANTDYSRNYIATHPTDRERRRQREQARRNGHI